MSLFFGLAVAVTVLGVSIMMYAELVKQLHDKEENTLRDNLQIQRDVLEHLARKQKPSQWQHEWGEYQEDYQKFGWQLVAPDGQVLAASPNMGRFRAALAHAGGEPGLYAGPTARARPSAISSCSPSRSIPPVRKPWSCAALPSVRPAR